MPEPVVRIEMKNGLPVVVGACGAVTVIILHGYPKGFELHTPETIPVLAIDEAVDGLLVEVDWAAYGVTPAEEASYDDCEEYDPDWDNDGRYDEDDQEPPDGE